MVKVKQKVLFLCTHNSARSQMAEGWLRHLYGDSYEVFSAGTQVTNVNPYVIRAMTEAGVDMAGHTSKNIASFLHDEFDFVVTVCDRAQEACPFFPGGKVRLHHSFADPAKFSGSDEQIMTGVRFVRDLIKDWIIRTFSSSSLCEER